MGMLVQSNPVALAKANSAAGTSGGKSVQTGQQIAGSQNGFAKTLVAAVNGEGAAVDAGTQGTQTSEPSAMLAAVLLLLSGASADSGDAAAATDTSAQDVISKLLETLDQADLSSQMNLQDNPALMAWLSQASTLLLTLANTGANAAVDSADALGQSSLNELASQAPTGVSGLREVLTRMLAAIQSDDSLKTNSQAQAAFQEVLAPLVAVMEQANIKLTDKQATTVVPNDKGVETAASGNANPIDSKAALAAANRSKTGEKQAESTDKTVFVAGAVKSDAKSSALQQMAAKTVLLVQKLTSNGETETAPATKTEDTTAPNLGILASQPQDLSRSLTFNTASKPVVNTMNADQFQQEMNKFILKNLSFTQAGGLTEAKFSLHPENLGQLDVKLSMHEGQLVAQFVAQTVHGKDAIESQISQLRAALQSQGIQVDKLEVTQSNGVSSSLFHDQRHQQSSQQFARQSKGNGSRMSETGDDFAAGIEAVEQRLEQTMQTGSFEATA